MLVVDASTDDTPRLVEGFGNPRFRLLCQDNCDGRCGARNQGIRAAAGEVVVILNADVRLPQDFFERIKAHYDAGADYVIVDSAVENWRHPFGAMVEAEHRHLYRSGREIVNWCEGYSCRRRCALAAGLFPEKQPVPICAGEDAVFGDEIAKRFRRVTDMKLVVTHSVPEDCKTFWDQRIGRGAGCVQRRIYLDRWSFRRVFWDGVVWTLKSIAWVLLIFPMVRYAVCLNRHLPAVPVRRLVRPLLLSRIGHEVGRWRSYRRVRRLPAPSLVQDAGVADNAHRAA